MGASPPTFETEWLDFKGAEKAEDKDVKKIWSQALAGFANTQGGVLIWGVDARKDVTTGVDAAHGLSLVSSPNAFKSRLLELHGQATDPPVVGVEVEAYSAPGEAQRGFVVCLVPESPFRPHRAENDGKKFYLRAGDDFFVPSVSILRSLFFPQSRPLLIPEIASVHGPDLPSRRHTVVLYLKNEGTATGSDVYIRVQHGPLSNVNRKFDDNWSVNMLADIYGIDAKRPLHPGTVASFLVLHFDLSWDSKTAWFSVKVYAHDAEPRGYMFEFTEPDLLNLVTKVGNEPTSLFFEK